MVIAFTWKKKENEIQCGMASLVARIWTACLANVKFEWLKRITESGQMDTQNNCFICHFVFKKKKAESEIWIGPVEQKQWNKEWTTQIIQISMSEDLQTLIPWTKINYPKMFFIFFSPPSKYWHTTNKQPQTASYSILIIVRSTIP